MPQQFETYRGVVNAWECDVVEHFTIAYYFDRFADATRNLLDLIGGSRELGIELNSRPSRLHVTFQNELRAGSQFHVSSGIVGLDASALRLGHQVIDSTSGKTVTWLRESIATSESLTPHVRKKLEELAVTWTGPKVSDTSPTTSAQGIPTVRDRVKPWEIDENGSLSLPGHVHRFSAAAMQTLAAIGMTGTYIKEQRRGFSTFEIDLHLMGAAHTGDMMDVTSVVTHLGSSSIRFLHTMRCQQSGHPVAAMSQSGVHLDMEARRSTPMPETLRDLAKKLLA